MPADPLAYYTQPAPMTDLAVYADRLNTLPRSIPELLRVVQGLLLHLYWADEYGITVTKERQPEVHIRSAAALLQRIWEIDPGPLTVPRPPEKRL
ncbi:MAG: transglutaminase domain-containing protein, partial [Anaerolineae bacterium]|nr:transglutaminase domain-containing protein [Anaerolineae bacterium]